MASMALVVEPPPVLQRTRSQERSIQPEVEALVGVHQPFQTVLQAQTAAAVVDGQITWARLQAQEVVEVEQVVLVQPEVQAVFMALAVQPGQAERKESSSSPTWLEKSQPTGRLFQHKY